MPADSLPEGNGFTPVNRIGKASTRIRLHQRSLHYDNQAPGLLPELHLIPD